MPEMGPRMQYARPYAWKLDLSAFITIILDYSSTCLSYGNLTAILDCDLAFVQNAYPVVI